MTSTLRRRQALACLGVALAGLAVPGAGRAANWAAVPRVPDVPLMDQDGRAQRLPALLQGHTVVLNFFFTGCATVCPPQTALLREAALQWCVRPALRDVRVLSLSVDPLGDGPAHLRQYARRFELPLDGGRWTLLTGEVAPLRSTLAAFDVALGVAEQHPALLWLGDVARGRWTRASALNAPEQTVRLLEALQA